MKVLTQPHFHPQPGPLDARGNCVGCATYDPQTTRVTPRGVASARVRKNAKLKS